MIALGVGTFLLTHVTGSPQETATTFLTAWQARFYTVMNGVTVNAPEGGVAGPLKASAAQLNMRSIHLTLGPVTQNGSSAEAKFTATATIADKDYQIKLNSCPRVLDDLNGLPVKVVNGATVYLRDVAQVNPCCRACGERCGCCSRP